MSAERFARALREALAVDLDYGGRPASQAREPSLQGRDAAVLMLFGFPKSQQPHLLLTRRAEKMENHQGQMAFPGGMRDPGEGFVDTALRETEEEVGVPTSKVEVIGELPVLSTVSTGFIVTPVLGLLRAGVDEVPLNPNPDEIAETIWVPLDELFNPAIYREEQIRLGPLNYTIHVYDVRGNRVWGATAAMIRNLYQRLAQVFPKLG